MAQGNLHEDAVVSENTIYYSNMQLPNYRAIATSADIFFALIQLVSREGMFGVTFKCDKVLLVFYVFRS